VKGWPRGVVRNWKKSKEATMMTKSEPKLLEHFCYDCDNNSQVEKPAVMQLCGRWLCQSHLEYWRDERGAYALLMIQRALTQG
jgi:hypothetical protein